jgi:ribonucleotide reductase beta subunit family protein with ferritin-like domain
MNQSKNKEPKTMKRIMIKLLNHIRKNKSNNQVTVLDNKEVSNELNNLLGEMKKSTWKRSDIDFDGDVRNLSKLDTCEKNILFMMCGFFLTIDSVVMDSLNDSLIKDLESLANSTKQVETPLKFYKEQNRHEGTHDEFYKDMGKAFFPDKYHLLQRSHEDFVEFKKVFDYCRKFQDHNVPLGERLLAYAFIECIVFFPFFAWIIRHRFSGNIPGTVSGNHWVCIEEAMHVRGHSYIYKLFGNVTEPRARRICSDLVFLVKDMWTSRILKYGDNNVNGFTLEMVCEYVDYLEEMMLNFTGFSNEKTKKNPFKYMNYISTYTRANFFERRVIEYSSFHEFKYQKEIFNNCDELKLYNSKSVF